MRKTLLDLLKLLTNFPEENFCFEFDLVGMEPRRIHIIV